MYSEKKNINPFILSLIKGEPPIKHSKYITFIITALILCPIVFSQIYSTEAESKLVGGKSPFPIINGIGYVIGLLFRPISFAEGYKASPDNITIGVNEKATIQVGNYNLTSGEFEPPTDYFFFAERFLTFEAEFPGGNPGGVWFVYFNPPTVTQKSGKFLTTNVTISLTSPPMADTPIQSTIIRIKIADTWVTKNLWWPEDKSYHIGGKNFSLYLSRPSWFLGALVGGFGKLSGKILTDYYYVDVLVKVKAFHAAKIEALAPEKLAPNEMTSIPVLVENQGNYNDTFNFRIKSETGYPLTLTNNGTITLRPGEQGQALVGVAAPANVLDTGTLHSIIIETYSAEQPNTSIATQRIFIETQGFYFSEQNSAYTIGFGFFILLVLFLLVYWGRKVVGKKRQKPEKPWKIPEEQQHLTELKRTDKKAYEQERLMMEDEYKSALLWYEDYRKTLRKKPKEKKPKKKPKEKPKKRIPLLLKKPEEKPKVEKVASIVPPEDTSKQKALAKIQNEQEKQLRKLKEK
jgi:hypothetical protein